MASGGETCAPVEEEGVVPLDIDDVHLLLQVEQEQIQKRTFTNWINAQLSKRSHPTVVQDLFSDLRDGTQLLDLLEVMSGQRMKRERGHGVFQQRGNIETALNFLKNKSIKLVNINIPDIIEGKPSIILGLIWTIILHCHIEELANTLSYGSRSSSLDSLSSLDSVPGSPSSSPVPRGGSPLHTRFRLSAKKSLLLWVRDQCKKVGCSASVRDFKSSWRSGEVFLAILCSLRPDLVDLSQAQTSSHRENLERAFHLAEKELGIPRLLEPEDVDVSKPDEKSIMTYIAQFLQYSNDLPAADDDFEASPSQKAREMKCWLEGAYQELLEAWSSTEGKGYAERYQAFQNFVGTYYDQRRPVIPVLSAMRRCAKPSEEQMALRKAWDTMEERLQEYRTELDVGLPTPLNTLGRWLQHMEAVLSEDSGSTEDHALAARDARHKQEHLEVLVEDLSQHLNTLNHYRNTDEDGCLLVPVEKLEEIKRRFTSARVTAKYHGIKLQYREHMHHVYNLLGCLKSKLSLWRGPYGSQESVRSLLQDWHDTVDKQGLLWMLKEALHKLKDTAVSYTKKAALAEDSPVVNRQVKEADTETEITTEAAEAVRSTMERVLTAWESYKDCLYLLQVWLGQEEQSKVQGQESKHFSSSLNEWRSRQAQLNEAGNFLIEISDASTSQSLTEELHKLNMHWADFIKRTKFAVAPQPVSGVPGVQAAQSLMQEASWVLRETVEVSSGPIRIYRKKLKGIIKKMSEFDLNSLSPSPDCKEETLQKLRQTLPETFETLTRVDQVCERLQKPASLLEGRLAELENWGTEAQEFCQHLKERKLRGQRGPHPRAKSLFSRGLQLEGQVVTESEDLQMLVTSMQKNSSLPYLSTLAIQDRLKRTVSHCQEVTEMLSSHGVKREGQPDGAEPASKVFVQAHSQPESQTRIIQHHQMFFQSGELSLESLTEPQTQELRSSQVQSQLEATRGVKPQVHDKSPKDQRKAVCQVQHAELKQPLLSTVVGRKIQMKPQTEVQLISVDSSQTSSFGPSDLQAASANLSQRSGFGPLDTLQVISVDPNQTSDFRPSELQVVSSQTSEFRPLDSFQVISVDSGEARSFGPSDVHVISVDSSQISGNIQSNPLQSLSSTISSPSTLLTSVTVTQLRMPVEQHLGSPPKWQPQTSLATPHQRQKVLAKSHSLPQPHEPSQTLPVDSLATCPSTLQTLVTETQQRTPIEQHIVSPPKWQPQTSVTTLHQRQSVLSRSHSFPQPSVAQGVPHVPVQNEVYARAQALARSRLDKAKQHLQEHIQDVITVISTRDKSKKQAKKKQAVSRLLRPVVLETFLEAVKGMGDFCSDAQLKDMDLLSHSVRAQWEVCATAAERSVHLEALRRITESLQATESVLLRTTHLRTDAKRVESAQHHTDSTSDLTPCQDGRVGAVKDSVLLGKTVLLDDLSHVHSQAVVQTNIVEIKQIPERTVIHPCLAQEEKDSAEEAQSSYSAVRSVFQQQLLNNSQQLGSEFPISPGGNASISADSLRSQLQHLLALKDQTEALWCEFELQDSQSSQHMEDGCNMEQEKAQLIQQWREQQMCIQARVKSLETAVELLESADSQIRLISDQIKQISQKPLNIRNLSIADPRNLHEDLKRLDERIEKELVLLNSGGSVSDAADLSHIELQAHLPLLPQTLHDRTKCLEQQRQCLRKSESALVGLVKLLSHLQQVSADLSGAHSTSDRSLVSIRHSLQQAREESVQLDRLLDDAGMRITLDDKAGSCNEMVSALALRTEEVEAKLAVGLKQSDRGGKGRVEGEQRDRAVGRKRMGLQVALREVLTALEKHGLKEPTLPALQHRLRFLTDTESKLVALRSEIQDLRSTCAQTNTSDTGISELQMQWENAHGAVAESREQCVSLSELLKKFQSCRNRLGSTLQKAEQTIGDQASYMGKDNLQLLISKVTSLKSDLSGLGDGVEEFRAVCRQLQSLMRRIPDCAEAPFESEADTLMDRWLDVTEKTDCHLDNLQAGFSLWEKLLLLAGEVEGWSAQKLMTLAESHPFQTEQDVSAMQDELRIQEENIEHFHRRSSEIQELLQSREFPLELQVIESQLRKKMAEVKELFSETSDVFTQLEAAKGKVASDIADHLSSIQSIANALTSLTTSATSESPQVLKTIQVLSEQLQAEAKQADALLQQINLLASIAGLENLQALAEDGVRLQESICTARELLVEKKEQAMNPNRPEIPQMIRDPKHVKPQIRKTEDAAPEIQSELGEKTQDALLELKDFKEQACSSALHQQGDFQVSEDVNRAVTLEESLREVQDVRVGLDESMNEELKCAMLIQQSQESLHSLQGQTEHSSQDSNASKAVEQGEGNLLEVENLSEVLQTSCTPEGQTALSQDVQTLFGKTPALRKILEDERTQEWNSDPVQSSIQCIEPQQPGVSTEELQSVQVAADSEVDDVDRINLEFLSTKEGSETEDKSPCTDQQAAEDVESLPSDHNTNKQQFKSGSKEGAKTGSALRDDDSTSCESSKPVFTIVLDSDLTKLNLIPLTQSVPASSTKWDTVSAVNDGTSETSENGLKLLEVKPDEEPYAVAADSEVDDVDRINLEFLSTKEGSETEDKSPCTDQQAAEDVESLPSDHNSNKQQFKSGSKERAKTGSALRDDDGTSCESSKPVFTIVLDSDLTKPNQIPLTQPIPGSSTKWDTVAAVGPDDGTSETSENGLKLLEVKPDEEPYAVSSSDKPVHLCADPSTSEVHFKENSHADHVEPTYSASDLDFSPKPEIDSSTQAMLLYPENLQESSGTAKKVFTIILDVDTPILSSDKYQSLQETQCTGPEDSITDEFSYLDIKNQQRSSSSPAKPEGQMVELDLSEKSNVKSSSSRSCEMKPHFLETMEIDIQEEKEKQHEVADVETSSQMDVHSESKSVVHQQDVPMLESHHEDDKNTFKEPSNEASTLQKPPKGGKGRRKNRKPVGVEKASNIGSEKPKSCKSRHKNTTDSESLRTSEVRLPETTDTSLTVSSDFSQTKSAMPRSTEDKLTVDTVQTLNQSETENVHFENVSISFTGGTLINTTDSVVLAAAESVRSTHTDDSKLMAEDSSSVVTADCITQVSTTIPSESQLGSAEAPSTGDSEGRFSLQYEEMLRANSDSSDGNKTSINRRSVADGEDQTRHAEQPTRTSVWATLLNTITNVHPLMMTSHGSEESRQRKDSWLQNSSLSESESSLAWTVLWVFRCRYRPSQLSVAHMTHQLEQAEICRQHVLEQVARLTQRQSSAGPSTEPEQSIGIEGRWNTALMDTSNMVEFKKAQLQQVTQYHQQKRVLTDTLHNLEAELSTLTQVCIDSSTLQAEKLNAFLKNMQKKRGILEELLQTCSQISSHLGEAEGPVACIEPFRALQERWQNIEQVASSSLWCANISTAEVSALLQEARNLHHELELLEKSVSLPHPSQGQMDCQSALKETVRTADFAVLTERYLYLFEVSQALSSSPLGKKELRDVEVAMQGLNSQLALTQEKLSSQTSNGSGYSPIMRIIRDYVTWAKQTESKVSRRRTLSLFPEEAIHQVNHMKKLQSETSLKRFQLASVLKELREEVTGLDKEDSMSPTLDSLEDLYVKLTEKTECAAAEMSRMFHIRERLWKQLTDSSSWLTSVLEKESGKTVASEPKTTIPELRVQLQVCTEALKEAERQAHNLETLLDELKNVNHGLSVPESFQLINRLTALQEEVSRVVNRKWALRWVLEELLHAQESSAEEQNVILKSLRQMSADVTRQKYPITRDSLSALEPVRHILMEFLCKVPEIQHCQEPRRKEMLNAVLDIQRRMHVLELQAKEHEEYLVLKQHMENSREAVKKSLSQIVDSSVGADVRLGFCQAVLVELPLLRMTCQEAADHLEAISKDLYPSQLTAERQKIRLVIEQLASWELTVKNEAKNLECSLAERLGSPTDLSPLTELFNSVRQQLKDTICLEPDNKTIDAELRKHWIRIQTVESVLRMLERCRKGVDAKSCQMTIDLGQRTLNDCGMHMDKLLQAREALKHYHWAVQLAESFFQQIGSNLMIPSDGFRGYKEEHRYIQQIFSTLVEGFQARLSDVGASVPQMTCLSIPLTEQLHIKVLSHLLVQDAKLEAQAQLRFETLQRSMKDQIVHMSHHEEVSQLLKNVDSQISKYLSQKPADSEACQDQQLKVKVLQTEIKNLAKRLEELREGCPGLRCKAPVDLMLGQLWRSWAVLQCRVESLKASMSHKEAEWRDFVIRLNKSKEGLDRLQNELPDSSVVTGSLVDLQGVLSLTERLQDGIEQEHHTLSSLQHHVTRLLGVSNLQQLKVSPQICQDLQSLQGHCRNLRDQSNNIRREVLFEIQELGRVQEELSAIQQNVLSLLTVLQSESAAQHLQEVKVELVSQKAQLQDVMDRVQKKWNCIPSEIQVLQNELSVSMQEAKDKLGMVMERSGPLCKMGELLGEVTVGLKNVQALLKQTSPNFSEAERTQKRVWDELDQWHTRIAELEAEVQDLAEQKPERAHVLMDQLTEPLQLYQTTAKQAEQRTALISKIPACLQEYDGILNSSNCWLREAQSWLIAPRTYTTAKCIHCHANSLKMMLDESEGYRGSLEDFLPALQEITPVCDTTPQQHLLQLCMQNITLMQQSVLDPLSHLQHLAAEMDAIEDEVKTMENNITKIRTILSATDTENISPEEHLENMQVILDNVQSMKRTIDEIESCRPGLGLPAEAEQTLTAFHWAQELLQPIQELQQLSMERSTALRASIGQPAEMILPLGQTEEFTMPHLYTEDVRQVSMEDPHTEEDDEDNQSSSSGTLTCSVPEDPGETTIDEEDFKTGADSAVTECVTKESSPEEEVDFPAIKNVIEDVDTGSCLMEPSGFSEMPGIDSRPVTEETSFLPAPTSHHLKELTKSDSANIAEEKQNECTAPAKPGIGSEITMLKAWDASVLIAESESVNTGTGISDQGKTTGPEPPDTEAVNVTDGDQTQTETKPTDATAHLMVSSQHAECVPHEDSTMEIQRNLNDAIIHQNSSQSQEHTFKHTATVSDLSHSEGGGEDQDIKVQLLTSLIETSETLGSCQDISALEESSPEDFVDVPAVKHVIQDADTGSCLLEPSDFSEMPGVDSRPVTEETTSLSAPTFQHLKEFTNDSCLKPDSANIAEEKQNECTETRLTKAVPTKPGIGSEITMLKASDAAINTETGTSDHVKTMGRKPLDTEVVRVTDGDQTQTASSQRTACVPHEETTLEIQRDLNEAVSHQSRNQSQEFQHTARGDRRGEEQDIKVQLLTSLKETAQTLGSCQDICDSEESPPEEVDFPAVKHVIQVPDTGIDSRPVTEKTSSLPAPTSQQQSQELTKPDSANIAEVKQNEWPETKLTEAVPAKPGTGSNITMLKANNGSNLIKESELVEQNEVSVNTETDTGDQVKTTGPKPPDTEAVNVVNVTDGDQTQTETKCKLDATAPLMLSSQHAAYVPQEDTTLEIQRDLNEVVVDQSSSQSQEHTFKHTATVSDLSQSEGGGEEDQDIKVQLLTSLKETSETLGSCQDISALESRYLLEIPVSALNASESQMADSTQLLNDLLSSIKSVQGNTWTLALERRRSEEQSNVEVQRCSEALLKGLRGHLELGSERLLRSQDAQPQNCSQLQSLLTGHKKYFQDLGQNLVVVKLLYQKLPEGALQGQAEVDQLISALQDQAQTHGVRMQHSLEEWSQYEEVSERLGKQLDEIETNISSLDSGPEGDLQGQLQSCERLHEVLKDTRPQVWEIQDRLRILLKKGCYRERPGQPVLKSQLLLRWMELHNQLQQKIQSTQKTIKNYDRFQHDSAELEEWIRRAQEQVRKWNSSSDSGLVDFETVFTQLMEFFKELEVHSAQKASAESAGAQILQLTNSEAPGLRRQLAQLEQEWTNLTNELPTLHQAQQQLLTNQTDSQILANLTSWLKHVEKRLEDESSGVHCALGSSELSRHLQALKDLKAEITSNQLYVDFLNRQFVEEAGSLNEPTNRSEHILFAEQLGALNLSWLILQGKIESKMHDVEDQWQASADREKRLCCMHSWISQRMHWVRNSQRPESCSQIEQTLQECEETEERLQVKSSELKALGGLHLFGQQDGEHPGDQAFSKQVNSAIQDAQALSQQINVLKSDLQPVKDEWAHFESKMSAAELQTTGVVYKLKLYRVPVLSSEQCRTQVEHLQELERELNRPETGTHLTEVFSDLKDKLSPYASKLLSDRLEKETARHQAVTEDVHADLLKAQNALRLWLEYERLTGECCVHLNQHWERLGELMNSSYKLENAVELLNSRMQSINDLEKDMPALQSSVGKVLEASKLLTGQMTPQSAPLIESETRLLSRDHLHLSKALSDIGAQVQEELEEHRRFSTELKSMEQQLKNFERIVSSSATSMESLKMVLLDLNGLNPNLAALNQTSFGLSLSSTEKERLQTLNTQWAQVFSQGSEQHRMMYGELLCSQSFQQKCQCWMELLDKIEAGLSNQTSGDCAAVRKQLAAHQRLKVETLISQQLQDAMINEASHFLESSQNEDRSHLIMRLTQLKARWQETQQRVQQHGNCLEGLMGHWQLYEVGSRRLSKLLRHIKELLPPAGLAPCSLQQLQCSVKDFELIEEQLQCHEELYRETVEAGTQILMITDARTQTRLRTELDILKEMWEQSCGLVGKRKALANTITHNWKLCETGLADSALRLEEIKARLKSPLPEKLEDLKTHMQLIKEDEDKLQIWAGGLKELSTMKADVSQYVLPTDTMLLQGQVEELHSQWEELCLKVSLRKQEIADRLNAWIIFNDKNKELCDWLTQMEKKVAHRGENLSIEEMVKKLKKDCMEEINLFSENKSHLKQLGEQLLLASDKAKEAEIHGALQDVNDRWQHLFDHIEARVKKLTETLVTVQQLDKNMINLRSWLTRIEAELAKPIHYSICHRDEIQKRLVEQQDLQRDIEQHTERVASVLTLCDVLLHDKDACSSDGENDSIQQTTQRLDQRWRNICSLSLERRLRIEETWRLWCKFQEDYSSFEDWLNVAERSTAEPNSSDVLYVDAKEELQKYEVFQKQVHESLTHLEVINNQYRRLARENRADAASRLRAMVHQGNQRWDALQRRVAAILRRLRHFTSQREEFEGTRKGLLVWLTEIDLQLTNVENFTESHLQDKIKQLKSFKKEITLNTNKIDALIVFGEGLIQRSCPQDAVEIEDELEELHTYCQEVFGRVAGFHQRLTSLRPLQEQLDVFDGEQSRGTQGTPSSSQPSMCLLSPPQERSGRETPVSVDSIPLEWDHTGDVGGSSSHDEEEDAAFFSALSGQNWHFQNTPERKAFQLDSSSPTHTSTPFKQGYVQLMSECSGSIKSVKRVSMILDDEEQQEEQGLTGLNTADKQSGVIERWELLQAQAVSKEQCSSRDPQQLTSDLHDITSWLDRVIPELDRLQKPETAVSVVILEERVKQLKEMQKTFARYKTMMLSLNLGGRELQQGATGGAPELQEGMRSMNCRWTEACEGLEGWEDSLRTTLGRCQEFHEMVHSQLLWLAHAESRRYTVNMNDPSVQSTMLQEHKNTLKDLAEELQGRQKQVSSLQEIVSELLPEAGGEDSTEAREKLHVIGSKLRLLSRQVDQDLQTIEERLESNAEASGDMKSAQHSRTKREPSPQRSFFYRVLRAAFPLHLLFLLLLVLACLVPLSEDDYSCTFSNNFARSFHPMLRYTNGPPPT
ncbi:nesprin-2 isoform X3 [Labeo rohita]|uniref:nesprin-2 isoform X3 n=1 Tax=Labeo rohita TaxID=84645 RepID=UPI0021E2E226|nr:nesprin-2 isoform X3 [Labeo rohita]